ncbi:MAG: copper homeostasis protein CutC [Chitinophagaceae bacterium]|nr:copper homeostasis protein CutC [Chitinophagaceae bacterium]
MNHVLEIIGFNIESCIAAQEAGAGRIELCTSPGEGGTSPSFGLIKSARKILHIPLYVMVRPRGGDFLYSPEEFEMMLYEIDCIKKLGADGVVIGILNKDGSIDKDRCAQLVEFAYPLGATFHRAFDRVSDPVKSIGDVISTGCERILTSGLKPTVEEGLEMIKILLKKANGEIIIMPGSGVRAGNMQRILEETGVTEIHSSASMKRKSEMNYTNPEMNENLEYTSVSEDEVRKMAGILKKIFPDN